MEVLFGTDLVGLIQAVGLIGIFLILYRLCKKICYEENKY